MNFSKRSTEKENLLNFIAVDDEVFKFEEISLWYDINVCNNLCMWAQWSMWNLFFKVGEIYYFVMCIVALCYYMKTDVLSTLL